MNKILLVHAIAFALVCFGCSKKDNGPQDPGPIQTPIVVETPAPATCPTSGFSCYDWGKCNGLFATLEEAVAIGKEMNATGCHRVDGINYQHGFGPCSECHSTGKMTAKSAPMSFEEILKARDYSKKIDIDKN